MSNSQKCFIDRESFANIKTELEVIRSGFVYIGLIIAVYSSERGED